MAEYYDAVLAMIPLSLMLIGGGGIASGLDYTLAIPIAGLIAALLVGHALFIRSPTHTTPDAQRLQNRLDSP